MQTKPQVVHTLLDALPYIRKFYGETIVIKYGGAAQIDPALKDKFAQDIALLSLVGMKIIIVHGGGKSITELSNRLGVKAEFVNGLRVSDKDSLRIAQMVLCGEINTEIVSLLNDHGAKAIGINGKDGGFVKAVAIEGLGYTGDPREVNPDLLLKLIADRFVPVVAPIAGSSEPTHPGFNVNADAMASAIAGAIRAKKTIFMTDTTGVLDKDKNLLRSLSRADVERLKADGTIAGGMIPKVDSALEALSNGVDKAHILDGRVEHALLLEIFTSQGVGTEILR
ncbi:MAG: acetylglutamate kinase [Helicobacteraceae bacterium]|jgi:acetylglutamate kinase|nr:acetylglutamate kinase [Helicobacteraceae bacterium]